MGDSYDGINVIKCEVVCCEKNKIIRFGEIKLDLFFNELSLEEVESINKESIIILTRVYRALRNYNITTCRINFIQYQNLFQMIQKMPDFRNATNFFFSFFRVPYESEKVGKEQDEYLNHEW